MTTMLALLVSGCEISSLQSSMQDKPWVIDLDPHRSHEQIVPVPPYRWTSAHEICPEPQIIITCPKCREVTYDAELNSLRIPTSVNVGFSASIEATWSNGIKAESLDFVF